MRVTRSGLQATLAICSVLGLMVILQNWTAISCSMGFEPCLLYAYETWQGEARERWITLDDAFSIDSSCDVLRSTPASEMRRGTDVTLGYVLLYRLSEKLSVWVPNDATPARKKAMVLGGCRRLRRMLLNPRG